MSLIRDAYRAEILGGLADAGEEVLHVFLEVDAGVLRERLNARVAHPATTPRALSSPLGGVHWVREADVLLADGGDATYLCHWMRESGLAGLLPSLPDTVWVGVSAGSMVMTPRIGNDFVE